MQASILIWLQFAICFVLIGFAGPLLSRSADVIADKTGLSGNWIGLILVATVTSLPELATGASAITFVDAPDIAIGDLLGSCVFNLAILAVLDFVQRGESVYRRVGMGHVVSAGFGVMMIGIVGLNVMPPGRSISVPLGYIGAVTPILLVLYVIAMRAVFTYERAHQEQAIESSAARYPTTTLQAAILRYVGAALVIVAAGIWLPFIARDLAIAMGWNESFVGTMFVAAVTSLPELVVTLAAIRIGAIDLAVANLLGSNLFNMLILGLDDIFFREGRLLGAVGAGHGVAIAAVVIMNGLFLAGLTYRVMTKRFAISWDTGAMAAVYGTAIGLTYLLRT